MSYLVCNEIRLHSVSLMHCFPPFILDHVSIHVRSSFPDIAVCLLVECRCSDTPVTLPKLSFSGDDIEAHETVQI